jgi:hypothetical protein
MKRCNDLEQLACNMVGDGKAPNIFFVTVEGSVQLISLDVELAYTAWRRIPRNIESSLEDRQYGTICTVEPEHDGSKKLIVIDDFQSVRENCRMV